jgi:hypothetical protein
MVLRLEGQIMARYSEWRVLGRGQRIEDAAGCEKL